MTKEELREIVNNWDNFSADEQEDFCNDIEYDYSDIIFTGIVEASEYYITTQVVFELDDKLYAIDIKRVTGDDPAVVGYPSIYEVVPKSYTVIKYVRV